MTGFVCSTLDILWKGKVLQILGMKSNLGMKMNIYILIRDALIAVVHRIEMQLIITFGGISIESTNT